MNSFALCECPPSPCDSSVDSFSSSNSTMELDPIPSLPFWSLSNEDNAKNHHAHDGIQHLSSIQKEVLLWSTPECIRQTDAAPTHLKDTVGSKAVKFDLSRTEYHMIPPRPFRVLDQADSEPSDMDFEFEDDSESSNDDLPMFLPHIISHQSGPSLDAHFNKSNRDLGSFSNNRKTLGRDLPSLIPSSTFELLRNEAPISTRPINDGDICNGDLGKHMTTFPGCSSVPCADETQCGGGPRRPVIWSADRLVTTRSTPFDSGCRPQF